MDSIADFFTMLRNQSQVGGEKVLCGYSRMREAICKILREEGYIKQFEVLTAANAIRTLRVSIKYDGDGKSMFHHIERASRPGKRVYRKKSDVPKVRGKTGLCIVSTSKGVLTGKQARILGVGGELVGIVW